jgi:hypothetical protein
MTSAFESKLEVELVDGDAAQGRGTWRLLRPLVYHSDLVGNVTVPAGYVTDFASVPRYIPIASAALLDTASEAATVHDWLYTPPHEGLSRATADAVLKEAVLATGFSKFVAWSLYLGVRLGGASHW